MNEKIDIHFEDVGRRKESIKKWKMPSEVKRDMLLFLNDLELGKVNKGKKINPRTQLKYINTLKAPLEYINKPLTKITLKDLEEFEKDLSSGILKSKKKKPYSHAVKADIRIALRILLRWKLGLEKANKLTDWFDCRDIDTTPDYLSEKEIEKLYKSCKSLKERFLIAVLFDAGVRIEEFLNIRYEDVSLPVKEANFVKITIKNEYSKTLGRNISLYWKHSSEAVRDFIEQRVREGIRTDNAVYEDTYSAIRSFLRRFGIRVLNKPVHPHLFRHSSATYYANKLNRQELCMRYGWKFSSDMPDIYISRAGMENKELDEKFTQTELGDLKYKLEKQEQQNNLMKERQERLEEELNRRRKFDPFLDKLMQQQPVIHQIKKLLDNGKKLVIE
ncbi:MAG: site-specific integrase [Nanoarchaeota archaeon]